MKGVTMLTAQGPGASVPSGAHLARGKHIGGDPRWRWGMAVYEFQCSGCHGIFEVQRSVKEFGQSAVCPKCGAEGRLLPSVFASSEASGLRVPAGSALRGDVGEGLRAEGRARGWAAELAGAGVAAPLSTGSPIHGETAGAGGMKVGPLRNVDIFQTLSLDELAQVARVGREVRLPQGTSLARQGHRGAVVYAILEGQVELTTSSPKGQVTIRIAGAGESLPLAALLGEGDLISTATAMTEVKAVEIPCSAFQKLCRQRPDIGERVYRAIADLLARRYRTTLNRLVGTMDDALRRQDAFANV